MTPQSGTRLFRFLVAASSVATLCPSVHAADESSRDGKLNVHGTLVVGESIRTTKQDAALLANSNSSLLGIPGASIAASGRNADDANLNFNKRDAVSKILKAYVTLDFMQGGYGFVISAKAWTDLALTQDVHPWGNWANGYVANTKLSDAGAPAQAKFSGLVLDNAYAFGHHALGSLGLDWKVGSQKIDWGHRYFVFGGLFDVNPLDAAAATRPGVLRDEESRLAVPALFFKLGNDAQHLEAFYQVKYQSSILPVDGTFYSPNDYGSSGALGAMFNTVNDRAVMDPNSPAAVKGLYIPRGADKDPSNAGQGGLAYKVKVDSLATEFGFYAAQWHSRVPFIAAVKALRTPAANGSVVVPNPLDAAGQNPSYFLEYPEKIKTYGFTFETKWRGGSLFGEYTSRPNQPILYNALDLLTAFLSESPAALTALRPQYSALARGGVFDAYERHKVEQFQVGAIQLIPGVLGAWGLRLQAEGVYKSIPDLPDPTVSRFGRSDLFGMGPVLVGGVLTNAPANLGSPIANSFDGFVSKTSYGYRVHAALVYDLPGLELTPSVFYGQDLHGWANDGSINEGRHLANVSLKATYAKKWGAELAWQPTWGGTYNILRDRGTLQANFSYKF